MLEYNLEKLSTSYLADYNIRYQKSELTKEERLNILKSLESDIDLVSKIIQQKPQIAVDLVSMLLAKAENDAEVAYIAAGPLEDLLNYHSSEIENKLMECVGKSDRMRQAIRSVWISPSDPGFNTYSEVSKYC